MNSAINATPGFSGSIGKKPSLGQRSVMMYARVTGWSGELAIASLL